MKATHPTTQHHKQRKRWLPISATAALLVVAGLIAVLAVGMGSPSPHNADSGTAAAGPTAATPSSPQATTSVVVQQTPVHQTSGDSMPGNKTPGGTATTSRTSATPAHSSSQSASASSLAGRIQPGVAYKGVATEYSAADGSGACLFGPSGDMMIAAMNELDYQNSEACGAHILVRAANGATVTVLITNECPYPCAPGQLDLSQQAFAKIADPKAGRIPITWQLVSPASSGTISVRYKVGSSQYWCGIQVIGERNPVARLEVSTGSGWQQLSRSSYNYFLSPTAPDAARRSGSPTSTGSR